MLLEDYLPTAEAARELGIHRESLRRLIREGRLEATNAFGVWMIGKEDLAAFKKTYDKSRGRRSSATGPTEYLKQRAAEQLRRAQEKNRIIQEFRLKSAELIKEATGIDPLKVQAEKFGGKPEDYL